MPTVWGIVAFLFIGALAGWLAGKLVRGYGFGLLTNIFVGVLGALIGGVLFDQLGVTTGSGFLWSLGTAFVGALVLLFIVGVVRRVF